MDSSSRAYWSRFRSAAVALAIWAGVVLVFVLQRVVGDLFRAGSVRWVPSVWTEVVYWASWLPLLPLLLWLAGRYPLLGGGWRRSALFHGGAGLVLSVVQGLLAAELQAGIVAWLAPGGSPPPFRAVAAGLTITALWKYWVFLGLWTAFTAARERRQRELEAARLETQLVEARLRALRGHLHPHFLFNALHSAAMLTVTDPPAAHRVLARLSDLLRRTLRSHEGDVSLAEELDFIERYLAIEQIRFSDRLRVAIDVPGSLRAARVPDLLLQPLVENAVRHGIARDSRAGQITVRGRAEGACLVLAVEDDGPGPAAHGASEGMGTGLAAVSTRLALRYPHAARLDIAPRAERGCTATITLPLQFA